jgi:hypothetical protein
LVGLSSRGPIYQIPNMCRGMWLRGLELAWFSFVELEVCGLVDLFYRKDQAKARR